MLQGKSPTMSTRRYDVAVPEPLSPILRSPALPITAASTSEQRDQIYLGHSPLSALRRSPSPRAADSPRAFGSPRAAAEPTMGKWPHQSFDSTICQRRAERLAKDGFEAPFYCSMQPTRPIFNNRRGWR